MEREAASAAYSDLHSEAPFHNGSFTSWAKERSPSHPYHFREGIKFGVADRDLTPNDPFTTKIDARPEI